MGDRLDHLGSYERAAVLTAERSGFAVVERAPEVSGCWVAWHPSESYRQGETKVFGLEVDALCWALNEAAGHRVTFVPWGECAMDARQDQQEAASS